MAIDEKALSDELNRLHGELFAHRLLLDVALMTACDAAGNAGSDKIRIFIADKIADVFIPSAEQHLAPEPCIKDAAVRALRDASLSLRKSTPD